MALITFQSLAFAFLASIILVYLRSAKSKLPPGTKRLPGPKGHPVIGSIPDLPSRHSWLKFAEWSKQYGPICQVKLAGDNCVLISSPQIAEDLLVKRQAIYSSRPHFPAITGDNTTSMMYLPLLANGSDHQRARSFAKRLMGSIPRVHLLERCEKQTQKLIINLLKQPQKFQEHLELHTSSISSYMAWGNSTPEVARETLQRANDLVVGISPDSIENKLPFLRMIPEWVPDFLQPWKVEEEARFKRERNFWCEMREQVKIKEEKGYTWTHETLKLEQGTLGTSMSDIEATYSVGMLSLIGGMLVSAPIQAWFLAMTHYPEWQARGQAEIDLVCGDRMPTMQDIQNLPVVRALIRETFRWRSPVPFGVPHLLEEDDVYDGYHIPKGSIVFGLEWAFNRDETLYPEAEAFNPARWLEPSYPTYQTPLTTHPRIKNHSGFGWGRRTCIGQDHAEAVIFTTIAGILWSCDIKKGKDEKGHVIEPPWLDYGPFVIVRPNAWKLDIVPRNEKRIEVLAELGGKDLI